MVLCAVFAALLGQQQAGLPKEPISPVGLIGVGNTVDSMSDSNATATVYLFLAHDCPIANRYAPEIKRIYNDYKSKGVAFCRVYIRSEEDKDDVVQHTKDFGYEFPACIDPDLKFVKVTGATVTPQAVVLGKDRRMLYRGRIDAQNVEHGKVREGYRRDLRLALDQILAGQPVEMPETAAVGCFIPGIG